MNATFLWRYTWTKILFKEIAIRPLMCTSASIESLETLPCAQIIPLAQPQRQQQRRPSPALPACPRVARGAAWRQDFLARGIRVGLVYFFLSSCPLWPFTTSHRKGAGRSNSRLGPSAGFEGRAARGIHSGHRGNFGKPIQERMPWDAVKPEGHAAPNHK